MTQQQENVMKLLRDLTLVDDEHLDVIEPEFEGDVVTINSVIENEFLDVGCRMTVSADGDVLCVDPDGQEARVSYREVPRAFIGYALSEGIEAAKEFTVQMDDGELPAFLSMLLNTLVGDNGGSDEDTNCGDPDCPRHGYLNRDVEKPKSMEDLKKRLGEGQIPFRVSMN